MGWGFSNSPITLIFITVAEEHTCVFAPKSFFQSEHVLQIGNAEVNCKNTQNEEKQRFHDVFCNQNLPANDSAYRSICVVCILADGFRCYSLFIALLRTHLPKSIITPSTVQRCRTETGVVS